MRQSINRMCQLKVLVSVELLGRVKMWFSRFPLACHLSSTLLYQAKQQFRPYEDVDDLLTREDCTLPLVLRLFIAGAKNAPIQAKLREAAADLVGSTTANNGGLNPSRVLKWLMGGLNNSERSSTVAAHHTGPRAFFGTKSQGACVGIVEFDDTAKSPFQADPGKKGRGLLCTPSALDQVTLACELTSGGLREVAQGPKSGFWYVNNFQHIVNILEAIRAAWRKSSQKQASVAKKQSAPRCPYADGRIARAVLAPFGPFQWRGIQLEELKLVSPCATRDNETYHRVEWGSLDGGMDIAVIEDAIKSWVARNNTENTDSDLHPCLLRPELLTMWSCMLKGYLTE